MSHIGKNIKKIRTVKNLSQAAFAQLFNLARPSVGAYEEGRSEPKIDTLVQIAQHFGLSVDALLTKELTVNELYNFDIFKRNYSKPDMLTEVAAAGTPENPASVPLVKASHSAQYIQQHTNPAYVQHLPPLELLPASPENRRAFEVAHAEMEPALHKGDVVLAMAAAVSPDALHPGRIYVLVTEQEVRATRLLEAQPEQLLCKPDSPASPAITVPIATVKELWEVQGVYTNLLAPPGVVEERLAVLERTLQQLSQRVQQLEAPQ